MKLKALFTALILVFTANLSFANVADGRAYIRNDYPSLEEVLTKMNAVIQYECDGCQYGVSKKLEGYYLTYTDYKTQEVENQLIWSSGSGAWVEQITADHANMNKPRNKRDNEFSQLYIQRDKFDFMLFYGYDEWATDVIDFLKPFESNLSSEDLEILARAYGELALTQINAEGHMRKYEFIDFDNANKLLEYAQKSMEYWSTIKKDDPTYVPLIIKDLDLKIGNENMHFYNLLKSVKMSNEAKPFLKNAWFPESYVQSAKNLLFGVAKDGFLFSQGDSDTFPLWYVQEKLNYRNDVVVLNTSLLYTPWYVQMNKEKHGYKSVLNQDNYSILLKKGIYTDYRQEKVPLKNWLANKVEVGDTSNAPYDLVPQAFVINYQGSNMDIKIKGNVLMHNDLVLLDIIASNPDRSFNFTTPYQLYSLGLVANYRERGKSFELRGEPQTFKSDDESIRQLDNLMLYAEMNYLKSLKHTGAYELNFICYGIQDLAPSLASDKLRLTKELINQLPVSQIVKTQNYTMIESMSAFYSVLNPPLNDELKKLAKPFALDRMDEISILNKNFDQDIADMEEIFSIYAGARVQWVKFETPEVTEEDKEVLLAMHEKVAKLLGSPVIKSLHWTKLKLEELQEGINALDLK